MKYVSSIIQAPWQARAMWDGRRYQMRLPIMPTNTHVNGEPIRRAFPWRFNFDVAWVDPGPSPAGNRGPYLKAEVAGAKWDGMVSRLYCRWAPGDGLFVREAYSYDPVDGLTLYRAGGPSLRPVYSADRARLPWYSASTMPDYRVRSVCTVLSVEPVRLHAMTNEDAIAEGVPQTVGDLRACGMALPIELEGEDHDVYRNRRSVENYPGLWDLQWARRGYPWASNPWVWLLTVNVERRTGR